MPESKKLLFIIFTIFRNELRRKLKIPQSQIEKIDQLSFKDPKLEEELKRSKKII